MCAASPMPEHGEVIQESDTALCIRCGRRGSRGFIGTATDRHDPNRLTQVMCANRKACDRRLRAAERQEARRGNWS